jgi:hypothetical protein
VAKTSLVRRSSGLPDLVLVRQEMARALGYEGHDEAILRDVGETLRDALAACDRFGSPQWDARLRAVERLIDLIGPRQQPTGKGSGGGAALTLNFGDVLGIAPPTGEVIDAEPA